MKQYYMGTVRTKERSSVCKTALSEQPTQNVLLKKNYKKGFAPKVVNLTMGEKSDPET